MPLGKRTLALFLGALNNRCRIAFRNQNQSELFLLIVSKLSLILQTVKVKNPRSRVMKIGIDAWFLIESILHSSKGKF